jgi:Fe-S cluster assembly protein SufD
MTLVQLNTQKLTLCPKYPEESWRKTNPEFFFLPQNEVLNFQGNSALETLKNNFLPWKVFYRNSSNLVSRLHLLQNILDISGVKALEAESHRIILVELGHGSVDIYVSNHLKSNIEFSSSPYEAHSIAPNSDIGFALASRLKSSVPHELVIKVESVGAENPLVIVANQLNPNFSQSYSALKFILAKSSHADFALIEGGGRFSFLRHSIIVSENAKLNQLWVNHSPFDNKNSIALHERYVKLEENAKFNDSQIMFPQGNTRVTSNIFFEGERAQAKSGVAVVSASGKFDYEPIQQHKAPQGKSSLNIKMILSGRARNIFQGLVIIDKNAPKTLALQNNKNLLLSNKCRVDASPRLEILPNDVMCKHGSATGELDSKQLYYMATRGFSLPEARKMIVKSFAAESLHNLEAEGLLSMLAESALDLILARLPQDI